MAGRLRAGLGVASLILIAGAIVLMFFVVLSGLSNTTPLKKTYFLTADTGSISGARPVSHWTYFYICGDGNQDCGKPVPALPFGYAWDSRPTGAPGALAGGYGHHTTAFFYYYGWRFGWVFYLLGLTLTVFAFFTSLVAPISRLASGLSGLIAFSALSFFTIGASLMTAVFVKARDHFRSAGMASDIGTYAFGFTWGAWAALLLASIFLFGGCAFGRSKDTTTSSAAAGRTTSKRGFFRRQRSRQSTRRSFVDNESQRRVKDEYA